MAEPSARFDPYGQFAALDRHRVTYVVIGGFARIIQGTEEMTYGLDIVPSTRPANLERLERALQDLNARGPGLAEERAVVEFSTDYGELKVIPEPAGTRGYEDLRRAALRQPLGRGARPSVASTGDLARMVAALGREHDAPKLYQLRHIMELERSLVLQR